ncbi:hypothetical protein [Mycolicibacter senuensis]|uniref:Uncharacterized protein n=1 Tax=Mycolicibacter senuensis TaxID=386913 RepID=A0A7I9XRF3_9MYCO|nr:hypothetical protein [Mycolicibacter senuensis]ORW64397.1 hypothetical protein AWC24_20640 [Mycolicibacter senuensis]GFG71867.1 hypothetical protein MSEN_35870 [Mycolicibacter senuensis]
MRRDYRATGTPALPTGPVYRYGGMVITVGSSGTLGTGGMVITEGSDGRRGRWRCVSLGAGGCRGGACRGGGGAAVVLEAPGGVLVGLVVLDELVVPAVVLVLDEVLAGTVLLSPGPRLVSWMMPQITSASISRMSPNQAISTDRRRNHGVGTAAAKSSVSGSPGSCCSNGL